MKKFLITCLVSLFLVSIICIGVSASDITTLVDTTWTINPTINTDSVQYFGLSFISNGSHFKSFMIDISNDHDLRYTYLGSDTQLVVYENGHWLNDSYRVVHIYGGADATHTAVINFFVNNATQTDDALRLNTSAGVKGSISFAGQVLNFIGSNSGVLALVGLSVALFLLVPFSIRKIKQFVKGY